MEGKLILLLLLTTVEVTRLLAVFTSEDENIIELAAITNYITLKAHEDERGLKMEFNRVDTNNNSNRKEPNNFVVFENDEKNVRLEITNKFFERQKDRKEIKERNNENNMRKNKKKNNEKNKKSSSENKIVTVRYFNNPDQYTSEIVHTADELCNNNKRSKVEARLLQFGRFLVEIDPTGLYAYVIGFFTKKEKEMKEEKEREFRREIERLYEDSGSARYEIMEIGQSLYDFMPLMKPLYSNKEMNTMVNVNEKLWNGQWVKIEDIVRTQFLAAITFSEAVRNDRTILTNYMLVKLHEKYKNYKEIYSDLGEHEKYKNYKEIHLDLGEKFFENFKKFRANLPMADGGTWVHKQGGGESNENGNHKDTGSKGVDVMKYFEGKGTMQNENLKKVIDKEQAIYSYFDRIMKPMDYFFDFKLYVKNAKGKIDMEIAKENIQKYNEIEAETEKNIVNRLNPQNNGNELQQEANQNAMKSEYRGRLEEIPKQCGRKRSICSRDPSSLRVQPESLKIEGSEVSSKFMTMMYQVFFMIGK